jgi:protein phosphatase
MLAQHESTSRRWKSAGLSDAGLIRLSNQDAFVIDDELALWIVADGMGGRAGGHIASTLTVRAILDYFKYAAASEGIGIVENGDGNKLLQMREAIHRADEAIRGKAHEDQSLYGMGTTIVAAAVSSLSPMHVIVGHVGDSRAYLCRDNALQLLTRDHSLVEELLEEGRISFEEAANHPQRHILVRALGIQGQAVPDIANHAVQSGDVLLLCTDGISKMLTHGEIQAHLRIACNSPEAACQELVAQANQRGGNDNSTAVVVSFA